MKKHFESTNLAHANDSMKQRQNRHVESITTWAEGFDVGHRVSKRRTQYFSRTTKEYLISLVPPGSRVVSLGCGFGETLSLLKPSFGLGIDISQSRIDYARRCYPDFEYIQGNVEDPTVLKAIAQRGNFDFILLEDTLGYVDDIQTLLQQLRDVCMPGTRLISVYYGYLWEPLLNLAEKVGVRKQSFSTTWLRMADVENFLTLCGFETVKKEWRILCPFKFFGIGNFINRYIATLPLIRKCCIRHYIVARALLPKQQEALTVSVVIPCRNEKGNIESALLRLPNLGRNTQIIFVEGHSNDGTWKELERVKEVYNDRDISIMHQPGVGKGDAVRAGFGVASGEVLMILDADLTVPPEDLSKFVLAIANGQGEFINGSRLIYGMDGQAMRFLNYLANHLFAIIFSYLINQRVTDTLCGTKVLTRDNYLRIVANRKYFGEFDPFGDFDLIFGASKLNLKILDVPIRYASRQYGETQISRFRHGVLLFRMVLFAYKKLKVY